MQQLTPQDAVFLALETPELPAHIGGLAILDPTQEIPFSFDHFVEFIRTRIGPCERFSWQLQQVPFGLDRPYWIQREDFDPADHIRRMALPAPYSEESLSELVGMLFERPLDKRRPLWEMFLIEGLPSGRHALLWKVHHCLMDGASGANLTEQLFDMTPDAVRPTAFEVQDRAAAGKAVPWGAVLRRAVQNATQLPARQAHYAGQALRALNHSRVHDARRSASRSSPEPPLRPQPQNTKATERPHTRPATPSDARAPRAPFNGIVGRRRGIAWSSVPLDDVKRLKDAFSVTVNDVILTMTGGAMRRYLTDRGSLPEASLIATVPLSLRQADDKSLGNQIRELPICWSTDLEDPVERLLTIHADANEAKRRARDNEAFDLVGMLAESLLPGALQLISRSAAIAADQIPLPGNAVVSNVAMTPFPLYCGGARIEHMVPISLLAPTQGLNITVLSYCGQLHFGIVHDPELVPDAWELAGLIPKSFQQLQAAADALIAPEDDEI